LFDNRTCSTTRLGRQQGLADNKGGDHAGRRSAASRQAGTENFARSDGARPRRAGGEGPHATEEVFIPVKGRWQVFWLDGDAEQTVDLDEGDVCNVPIGIYRGFRNLSGGTEALLMAIIGGPDAGKVDWHPSVVTEARKTGLSVDDDGNLILDKPAA
jgi:hypothetical protein